MTTSDSAPVQAQRLGELGHIRLNRPKALNAINLEMVRLLTAQLQDWASDPAVHMVLVTGAGEKAFCAGGDVKSVALAIGEDQYGEPGTLGVDMFREEYALNYQIATYPKPYFALMDGITMGGGVGVSLHGDVAIATNRTKWAMPETAIGFFPDVGGTYFLSRLGPLGTLLGLTGWTLSGAEAKAAGVASYFVAELDEARLLQAAESAGFSALKLKQWLAGEEALGPSASEMGTSEASFAALDGIAKRCFGQWKLSTTFESLEQLAEGTAPHESVELGRSAADQVTELAKRLLEQLGQRAPTSLRVTLEALRRSRHLDLAACLHMEYRLSQSLTLHPDFREGIRAVLIDKDYQPNWNPADSSNIESASVERFFRHDPNNQLNLG
ncbi:MAG: enoyl-CoA hydratase/isomerase family protein [Pirellulaceae bacterium]